MDLPINNKFEITNPLTNETFKGVLLDLSSATNERLKEEYKGKDRAKIFKDALKLRVVSDDKAKILKVAKRYGYELVFKTILVDVLERTKLKKKDL